MDLNAVLDQIKAHPDIRDAGMVLFHVGLVRSFSLNGSKVTALEVEPDMDRAVTIIRELKERPGIVDIQVRLNSGRLEVGRTVMLAAVAGHTRDQVFPVLQELVERLKKEASRKREIFA